MNGRANVKESVLRCLCVLLTLLLSLALSGCYRSTPLGADITGGKVGRGGFTFLQWDQGPAIMIWHDLDSASTHGSGSTGEPIYRLIGYASSLDGRRVEWKVQTRDSKAAQFWIDDVQYDLATGALFVITTRSGATDVRQLDRDLSGIQADYDSCIAFARGDPDLAHFIDGLSDSQTETQISSLVEGM